VADFAARRAAAYQAFYEHMPLRASVLQRALQGLSTGAEMRIYGSARFGQLATLHLLDTRQYRDAQVCSRDGKPGSSYCGPGPRARLGTTPRRSLLGALRKRPGWTAERWRRAATGWNLIWPAIGARRARRPAGTGPAASGTTAGTATALRARSLADSLCGRHAVAQPGVPGRGRARELGWPREGRLRGDRPAPTVGVEFCGTSITSRTSSTNAKVAERLAENPHFVFSEAESRGYGIAEFTPGQLVTTLRVVDDVTKRDSGVRTLARFAVESGRPAVERA
jgi:alkaline phosphatase D